MQVVMSEGRKKEREWGEKEGRRGERKKGRKERRKKEDTQCVPISACMHAYAQKIHF